MIRKHSKEMNVIIEIYFGPRYRSTAEAQKFLGRISDFHHECHITSGPSVGEFCAEKYGCDVLYGLFHDEERVKNFAEKINGLEGVCAKIRHLTPKQIKEKFRIEAT